MIIVQNTLNAPHFSSEGSRPGWTTALKRWVIEQYNILYPAVPLPQTVNLGLAELDRCHKTSFSDIQRGLLALLNGWSTTHDFERVTDALYSPSTAGTKAKAQMQAARGRLNLLISGYLTPGLVLKAPPGPFELAGIADRANELLRLLNSAIGNVLLGNAATNRTIQEMLDAHFRQTSTGEWQLTPDSRRIAVAWQGQHSGVPLTPSGGHVMSSASFQSIDVYELTPSTYDALFC